MGTDEGGECWGHGGHFDLLSRLSRKPRSQVRSPLRHHVQDRCGFARPDGCSPALECHLVPSGRGSSMDQKAAAWILGAGQARLGGDIHTASDPYRCLFVTWRIAVQPDGACLAALDC